MVTSISDESNSAATATATQIQAGTTLNAGQTILTLSNYKTIELDAQVDETQISSVKPGQAATVTTDAVADRSFSGKVTAVSPSATVQNNIPIFTVTVQIANPELILRPGMTAEASIEVKTLPDTLSVPSASVQTFGGRSVIEVEQAGRFLPLPVELVGTDGLNTVVQAAPADQTRKTGRWVRPARRGRGLPRVCKTVRRQVQTPGPHPELQRALQRRALTRAPC